MKVDSNDIVNMPKISMSDLNRSNTTYLALERIDAACKAWLIDGEWKEGVINHKPKYLFGAAPDSLQFDQYHIFTLSKIYNIKLLESFEDGSATKVYKEGVLK